MTVIEQQQDRKAFELTRIDGHGYDLAKRVFDLVICIFVLPVVSVLIMLIAVVIALDSPGSPIFTQERIGKGGRRFLLYKFRTMAKDYDDRAHRAFMQAFIAGQIMSGHDLPGKPLFKPPIQNHITRVGRILRKTSLDELPQILNVLRGEMSLVGPRPNVPWEVEKYLDWHRERLRALPGITGLAQVRGRSGISFDTIVRYDLEYFEKQCLLLDMKILWWTVTSVIGGRGAG